MAETPHPSAAHRDDTLARMAREHPGLDAAAAAVGVELWSTAVILVRAFETHLQRYGLTSARFAVLLTLQSAPGHRGTPSALAERINVSRPTVTGILDGLVRSGLVRRVADREDRRRVAVELTDRGRTAIARAAPDHFTRLARAVTTLGPRQRTALRGALALCRRVAEALVS